jgi:hypothetical protein
MTGWAPILAAARGARLVFEQAWREPRLTQLTLLRTILAENAATAFGRAHDFERIGFERIDTIETFRARVPIRDHDDLRPFIDRAAAGEGAVLTREPLVACEETGGTTSGRKLIPYTCASLAAFRAAVLPWLGDLAQQRAQTFEGRAYVAISPVARAPRVTTGGIPVGLPGEGAYLGEDLAAALASVLAVPADVGRIRGVAHWRLATLRHLLAAPDLTFVSVWSPTFLIGLIEALPALTEPLIEAVHARDRARARLIGVALSRRPIDTQLIWPRLATVSAWADGASQSYARRLQELLPHAALQPKGLLATEGAITIPWQGSRYCVPALTSVFLEFIDDAGRSWLCDELSDGASYRVVMTSPGGLYRYDLGDRLHCHGHTGGWPRLEFVGRAGVSTDIVGEKLCEDFVAAALSGIGAQACLAARASATPCYELLVDSPDEDPGLLAARVEQRLRANPQYAYARALGQLGPVEPRPVAGLLDRYMRAQAQRGRRLAEIKPPTLIGDLGLYHAILAREDRPAELLPGGAE